MEKITSRGRIRIPGASYMSWVERAGQARPRHGSYLVVDRTQGRLTGFSAFADTRNDRLDDVDAEPVELAELAVVQSI